MIGIAGQKKLPDDQKLVFLTVNAKQKDNIHFAHIHGNKVIGKSHTISPYEGNGIVGTLDRLYLIFHQRLQKHATSTTFKPTQNLWTAIPVSQVLYLCDVLQFTVYTSFQVIDYGVKFIIPHSTLKTCSYNIFDNYGVYFSRIYGI